MTDTTYVTREEFDALPEYSSTPPTDTTIGKKWKRHMPYRRPDACIHPQHDCGHWLMGENVPGKGLADDEVWIHWTKLVIGAKPRPQWCPEED